MAETYLLSGERRRALGAGERLEAILLNLARRIPTVRGSAVADRNGLPIASKLPIQVNTLVVTAMSTLAVRSCSDVLTNLNLNRREGATGPGGDLVSVLMIPERGELMAIVKSLAGGTASLLVVLDQRTDIGLLQRELASVAQEVERVLQG